MKLSSRLLGAVGFTLVYLTARPILLAQGTEAPPPTNVWAAQTDLKTITLVWTRQPEANGYRVYPVGGTPNRSIPTGELAKNVDRLVLPVVPRITGGYSYDIAALYPRGRISKKVRSNVVVPVIVKPAGEISAPGSVSAVQTGPGTVTVTWTPVSAATAYVIGRAVTPDGLRKLCELCSTATKYIDRGVTAGAKHRYSVSALTPIGPTKRTMSNEVTPTGGNGPGPVASEDSTPPGPPSEVKAVAPSPHSIELSWRAGQGATGYEISRRMNNGEARVLVPMTEKTRYVDNQATVDAKGALSYGVTSLNSNGRSEEVTVSIHQGDTAAGEPPKGGIDLKAALKSSNLVIITWGGLTVGHHYGLRRRVGSGPPSIIATIVGTMTQYTDRLPPGIQGQVGYVIEDLNGKGASHEALLTINTVTIDSAKTRSDSAGIGF